MNKFDFITIGSATKDIMYYVDGGIVDNHHLAFELGAKFEISQAYFNYGGGANNTAVALAKLGFKTSAIIAVGEDDFGVALIKNLKKQKVNNSLVQIHKDDITGMSIIINNKDDKNYILFVSRGANKKITFSAKKNKKLNTKWFYINSLNFENWEEIVSELIKFKEEHAKTLFYWNPGKLQINAKTGIAKILKLTEVLQVNKLEAISLIKNHSNNKNPKKDIKTILKTIYDLGPKIVVITDGKDGAYCFDGTNFYEEKPKSDICKDATGAGDAFGSAFVAGLEMFKGDTKKALQMGIANAGSVISEYGAQNGLLNKKNILKIIKK
jgi:sugar/nucleoside kinase (ribokinase family)